MIEIEITSVVEVGGSYLVKFLCNEASGKVYWEVGKDKYEPPLPVDEAILVYFAGQPITISARDAAGGPVTFDLDEKVIDNYKQKANH